MALEEQIERITEKHDREYDSLNFYLIIASLRDVLRVLVAVAVIALAVFAYYSETMIDGEGYRKSRGLNLTEAQRKKIDEIRTCKLINPDNADCCSDKFSEEFKRRPYKVNPGLGKNEMGGLGCE